VNFEMFREVADALTEDGNLNFRRTGVGLVSLVRADDFGLLFSGETH
jgi:hypothetical protein